MLIIHLVQIISYHIINILYFASVITELGVGNGNGCYSYIISVLKTIFKLSIYDLNPSCENSFIASKSHTVNKLYDIVAKYLISGENLKLDISDYDSNVNISCIPISST